MFNVFAFLHAKLHTFYSRNSILILLSILYIVYIYFFVHVLRVTELSRQHHMKYSVGVPLDRASSETNLSGLRPLIRIKLSTMSKRRFRRMLSF